MKEKTPAQKGLRITVVNIAINSLLAAIKALAGILGNSYALLADAVDSLADIFSSIVVYSGIKIATAPPDDCHPYGHGKAEPLAGMVVAFALFVIALGIGIKSVEEIITPQKMPAPFTLIVLIVMILIKEGMFRVTYKAGRDAESSAIQTDAWHHRSDALTSAAAFIGISIALIGGPRFAQADAWAALVVAGIIILNALRLFKPALDEVMDKAPAPDIEEKVRAVSREVEGVVGLDKCFIRKMGFNLYVDLHVLVDGDRPVREGHDIAHNVKRAIREADTRVSDVLIHIEPHT